MTAPRPDDREISEPGIVGRIVVVVAAAIATITLFGWITLGATGGLFDDDDEPCEGVDCPPTTTLVDDTGDGSTLDTTIAPTGDVPTDSAPPSSDPAAEPESP